MNEVWNLDPIYKGFDDPQFEADLTRVKELVAEYGAFAAALAETDPAAGLVKGIAMQEEITHLVGKLAGYSSLRQSANTLDPTAGSHMGRVMAVLAGLAAALWEPILDMLPIDQSKWLGVDLDSISCRGTRNDDVVPLVDNCCTPQDSLLRVDIPVRYLCA
mgnify:CR=1 FL=1